MPKHSTDAPIPRDTKRDTTHDLSAAEVAVWVVSFLLSVGLSALLR